MGLFRREPQKYDLEWIAALSDEDWKIEREKVQDEYRKGNGDMQKILYRFDEVMRKRYPVDPSKNPFPARSEHGWHLPSDD